jgi:hypothetical protein
MDFKNIKIKRKKYFGNLVSLTFLIKENILCNLKKENRFWFLIYKNKKIKLLFKKEKNGRIRVFQDYQNNNLLSGWFGRQLYKYAFIKILKNTKELNIETSIFHNKCKFINSSKNIVLKLENSENPILSLYKSDIDSFNLAYKNVINEFEAILITSFLFIC